MDEDISEDMSIRQVTLSLREVVKALSSVGLELHLVLRDPNENSENLFLDVEVNGNEKTKMDKRPKRKKNP